MLAGEAELVMGQLIFTFEIAEKHRRVVRVQRDHEAGIKVAAHWMVGDVRTAARAQVRRNADFDGNLALDEHVHEFGVMDSAEPMANAFRSDVQSTPDAFRPYGFAGVRSEVQACVASLCVELAKRFGADPALVSADA